MLPTPRDVEVELLGVMRSDIRCARMGGGLVLDTPYIMQDGSLFQAYITRGKSGGLHVSDGGHATNELEIYTRSDADRQECYEKLAAIAARCYLTYANGRFEYDCADLSTAMQRLPVLAQAVDGALALAHNRPARKR